MRTSVKNPQQAQGAPVADVQPTKQAPASPVQFRDIPKKSLSKYPITEEPQTFIVSIEGKDGSDRRASVEWLYDARHPYMALGQALVQFGKEYFIYRIVNWQIAEPYIKKSRTDKK